MEWGVKLRGFRDELFMGCLVLDGFFFFQNWEAPDLT